MVGLRAELRERWDLELGLLLLHVRHALGLGLLLGLVRCIYSVLPLINETGWTVRSAGSVSIAACCIWAGVVARSGALR